MKFALLTVTYSGQFYSGKALGIEQQIRKAKLLGFDGLAIETKRPVASPLDFSGADRQRIKAVASDEGMELCALESMSNFSSRISEDRENNLAMMRQVLELAHDLGISLVKVFAAWPGIIDDEQPLAMYAPYERGNYFKPVSPADLLPWNRAVRGIREVADWAADAGITLALQNHAPVITPGYEDVLAMTQQIDRKNVKICLDVPLFYDRQSTEYVREAVEKCQEHLVYTHYGAWNFSESPDGEVVQEPAPYYGGTINYETFIEGLDRMNYGGYLVSEYCLPVIRDHQIGGVEIVDQATAQGLRYMKKLVRNKSARKPASKATMA